MKKIKIIPSLRAAYTVFFLFFKSLFILGGGGRGREREPTNREIMTWAEIKSQTLNRLRHPGAPHIVFKIRDCPLLQKCGVSSHLAGLYHLKGTGRNS